MKIVNNDFQVKKIIGQFKNKEPRLVSKNNIKKRN